MWRWLVLLFVHFSTWLHSDATSSFVLVAQNRSGEDPTVKESIWDMGKDMCKGREDHPQCKRFFKDKKDEEKKAAQLEEAPSAAPAPAPAVVEKLEATPPVPAPAPTVVAEPAHAPAPAPTLVAEPVPAPAPTVAAPAPAPAVQAPAPASVSAPAPAPVVAAPLSSPAPVPMPEAPTAPPAPATTEFPNLAETTRARRDPQISGAQPRRRWWHRDGKTATDDWHDEYAVPTTNAPVLPTTSLPRSGASPRWAAAGAWAVLLAAQLTASTLCL